MTAEPAGRVSLIRQARTAFHEELMRRGLLAIVSGVPTNADSDNKSSVAFARKVLEQLPDVVRAQDERLPGQTAGAVFEQVTRSFVERTFSALGHLRPGKWAFPLERMQIASFEQYSHLEEIEKLAIEEPELAVAMGRNYIIKPDVVIVRYPEEDERINTDSQLIVDESVAERASLRSANRTRPQLHASISCKWTLRNDRAQNARSEALILVRNRKGRLPHTVVLTADPLPSRLASLALGTGDLDCVYHFALPELMRAVAGDDVADDLVKVMVDGKRLKDISDLPLDLVV